MTGTHIDTPKLGYFTIAKYIVVLHLIVFLYSLGGILAKLASKQPQFSLMWCILYAGILFLLFVYAIGWQLILKRINLTVAFCNKAATIVWGMLWGFLIFNEVLSWQRMLGAALVIIGVVLAVRGEREHA